MEIFYDGLNKASQTAANVVVIDGLFDKTYIEAKDILDRISINHEDYKDNGYNKSGRRRNNNSGMPENDMIATLQMQLVAMTSLLQTLTINQGNAGNGN